MKRKFTRNLDYFSVYSLAYGGGMAPTFERGKARTLAAVCSGRDVGAEATEQSFWPEVKCKQLVILEIRVHLLFSSDALKFNGGNVGARCSDLILYPVSAVDQSDQYRFDYSDVSFGNTHAQGATVAITCTTGGQPATVEGYDQQRTSISAAPSLLATCTNVGGSQYTWTILGRILQFVDCRF
ncbi:hypothetical protein NECAME_09406 [Necator americanus]|uniref:Uncharacterized protein n=1 Tax=Necator americanus TaxID=51031 RepID=W2TFW6_NECAM|nr:hypothetical protein NECAME_09406 [Necator americanus]ETN80086.1 hypothetical protein NECAME_09406 [Necator americanus]